MTSQIAIVNTYGDDNRGSAALNMAAIHVAEKAFPGSRIGLVTISDFDSDARQHSYRHTIAKYPKVEMLGPVVRQASLRAGAASSIPAELAANRLPRRMLDEHTAEFLRHSDLVLSRGGVIYRDCSSVGRLAAFLRRTTALRVAQAAGVPTVLLGLHAGRPNSPAGSRLMRRQYEHADLILPRGPRSEAVVHEITSVPVTRLPDSVVGGPFLTPAESRVRTGHLVLAMSEPARPLFDRVVELVKMLSSRGEVDRVTVVAHSIGLDDDVPASIDIAARMPVPATLMTEDLSPDELIGLYRSADMVVASRLHAAILGLLARTPSYPIELSQLGKAVDTFSEIGLGEMVLDPHRSHEWHLQVAADGPTRERTSSVIASAAARYGVLPGLLHSITENEMGAHG